MKLRSLSLTLVLCVTATPALAGTAGEIDHLIGFIADSDCTFIRNGQSYEAKEASRHIQRKYDYIGDRITTTEQFISFAASESSLSGKPYRVTCPGGRQTSADWLTTELNRYRTSGEADSITQR